jgi:4-diphosphocytidyl-2-C-methyl-D-erythritol kinase
MLAFPGCKLNLGLHILAKRKDGYHDIETCFFPIPWTDVLEFLPAAKWSFECTGLPIAGNVADNLCVKAYELLKNDFSLPAVAGHLHKILPMGAGLGGGSADGAHTLRILNQLFHLHLSANQLAAYAMRLGSDCSHFLQDRTTIGRGRGEILVPLELTLKGHFLVVVSPEVQVSTAEAYSRVIPQTVQEDLADILRLPIHQWRDRLTNHFEATVFERYPALEQIKKSLYEVGAVYASLSGSGASLYGIFTKQISREEHFQGMNGWSGWL